MAPETVKRSIKVSCMCFISPVGSPIPVEKVLNPTQETIDKLHSQYIEDIKELYEKYNDRYHPTDTSELMIV